MLTKQIKSNGYELGEAAVDRRAISRSGDMQPKMNRIQQEYSAHRRSGVAQRVFGHLRQGGGAAKDQCFCTARYVYVPTGVDYIKSPARTHEKRLRNQNLPSNFSRS